jgi:hypothetical protein
VIIQYKTVKVDGVNMLYCFMLRNGIELDTFVDDFEHNLENGKSVADNPAAGVTYFINEYQDIDYQYSLIQQANGYWKLVQIGKDKNDSAKLGKLPGDYILKIIQIDTIGIFAVSRFNKLNLQLDWMVLTNDRQQTH